MSLNEGLIASPLNIWFCNQIDGTSDSLVHSTKRHYSPTPASNSYYHKSKASCDCNGAPLFKVISALSLHPSCLLTSGVYSLQTGFISSRTGSVSSRQPTQHQVTCVEKGGSVFFLCLVTGHSFNRCGDWAGNPDHNRKRRVLCKRSAPVAQHLPTHCSSH